MFRAARGWILLAILATSAAARPVEVAVAGYQLTLRIDVDTRLVTGDASVELEARDAPASEVRLALNDLLKVSEVERDGKKAEFKLGERIAEGRSIVVALDPPLAAGSRCRVRVAYSGTALDPGESDSDWMGVLLARHGEIRMSHQSQWYPILPRDDAARSKWPAPVELALDLPAGYESLGPGALKGTKKQKGREIHTWTSVRPVQASILAGKFKAQNVEQGKSAIRVLSRPEHASGAKLWAEDAAQSLAALGELFGKLESARYGMAEMQVRNRSKSYNYEADGFSVYDGVLFDGRAPDSRKIAHEVAHLWFGGAVDATGPGERFLTEGLAEFGAWLAVEARSGAPAATEAANKASQRYFGSPGDEHGLATTDFNSPRYVQVAYSKGAFAMRTLRAWIGENAMSTALRAYLVAAKAKNGAATLDDLLAALRAQNADAAKAWEDDWLRRAGVPSYAVELTGPNAGKLVQKGELYRNPIELECTLAGGTKKSLTVSPTAIEQTWSLDAPAKIESVTIDPRVLVLFARSK